MQRQPLRSKFNAWVTRAMLLIVLAGTPAHVPTAAAAPTQAVQIQQVTQQDRDEDGAPDLTIIDASFVTQSDRVLVYDRDGEGGNMQAGSDWQQVTDFRDDTWIFDVGADGNAQLVIQFSHENGTTTAELYSDQNSDGVIAYEVRGRDVLVREDPFRPPLTVTVQGDWIRPDGRLNWNLLFQADGSSVQLGTGLPDIIRSSLRLNSDPDAEMEFKDQNDDGIPEYGVYRFVGPSRREQSFPRTLIWSNDGNHEPLPSRDPIFWPLLDGKPSGSNYFDTYPIIHMNWATARISRATIHGYPIEHGYHLNTLQYFEKNEINYADFENPMAYYDLAGDQDDTPELHVRIVHQRAGDRFREDLPVPVNDIRWSWNQFNEKGLIWDYKLGLAGRHPITSTIMFPDFAVQAVPHAEIPTWVTSKPWDYATFVAREGARDLSSEGIYPWPAVEALDHEGIEYLAGQRIMNLDKYFHELPVGWRGDFVFELNRQPYVYISPVDRKLHLLYAQRGVWSIDESSELRYANLDDDAYLDQWTYTEVVSGAQVMTFTKQLNVARSHALYSDGQEVILRRAPIPQSLYETLPPTNPTEWASLKVELESVETDLAPDDFIGMMQQFVGPEVRLTGAAARDYRPVGEGFRFVLDLQPDFRLEGEDMLGVAGLEPGTYAVTYDGSFTIEPLRLPVITATMAEATLNQLEQGALYFTLRNDGLQDLPEATLELWAAPPEGEAKLAITETVTLLAQEPLTSTLYWAPPEPGDWTVTPKVRRPDGLVVDLDVQQVTVLPSQLADSATMVTHSTSPITLLFAVVGAIIFASVAALAFWQQWRRVAVDHADDTA